MSLQRLRGTRSATITTVDNVAHTFTAGKAAIVYFRAGTSNTGTVTIGAAGSSGGLVLAAGDWSPPIGPINDLSELNYQFSASSNDTLGYLLLQ